VGHGRSNSFDRMIALEPFRRSASGRNKLPTYLLRETGNMTLFTFGGRGHSSGWDTQMQFLDDNGNA
jgi:hypothetical protein